MYVCLCVCATFFLDLILFSVIATKVPDSSQDSDDVKWPRIVSVNTAQWCFTMCQCDGIRESVNSETYIVRFEGEPLLLSINMCRPQLTYITLSKTQKEVASSQGHSQILSRSRGEKSGEGLGSKLRHRLETVDSVSTNRVHVTY